MDSTTFGSQKAAKELARDLDKLDDRRVNRQVCNFLAEFNKSANEITKKVSGGLRNTLLTLYCKDRIEDLNTYHKRIPTPMKTFITNLIRTKTRSIIRGYL